MKSKQTIRFKCGCVVTAEKMTEKLVACAAHENDRYAKKQIQKAASEEIYRRRSFERPPRLPFF